MLDSVSQGPPPRVVIERPKPFRISTVLGQGAGQDLSDPLLLAQIDGAEGVSIPYGFDLTVLQPKEKDGVKTQPIKPSALLNTPASFGVSEEFNQGEFFEWHDRRGVIERFEEVGQSPFRTMRCYTARLVPSLKLLDRERTFRIFEDTDALTAIRSVAAAHGDVPPNYILEQFDAASLPKMPYIVQFGEDTLSFVHRLMAIHGLWYYFVHDDEAVAGERMILGRGRRKHPAGPRLDVDAAPGQNKVGGYRRVYAPGPKRIRTGEFNPLRPTQPFQGSASVLPANDPATANVVNPPGRFQHTLFPAGPQSADGQKDAAKHLMEAAESQVIVAVGQTKHRGLRAAGSATVFEGDKDGEGHKCLLITLSLHGIDASFGTAVHDLGDFLKLCFDGLNPFGDGKIGDISSALAQTGIGQFLRDAANTAGGVAGVASTIAMVPSPLSAVLALPDLILKASDRVGSVAAGVTDVSGKLDDSLKGAKFDFGASFVAVSQADVADDSFVLPPPTAARQVARGPHCAVVIGPHGSQAPGGDDLWADPLGRVRVRFPWEPPDESGDPLAEPPFDSPERSAWLRVSEGWAGAGWGTQFLPRVGQEVLVDFIDGDPERPVVVGRVYNAESRGGGGNLPFPSNRSAEAGTLAALPAGASARWPFSGLRTHATPRPDGEAERFHLLRFDDTWGKEQLLLRSQGRMDQTSSASTFQTSHADRHVVAGGKDPKTGKSGGSLFTSVFGEEDRIVSKSRYVQVDEDDELTVKGHVVVDATGKAGVYSKDSVSLSAPKILVEASTKISLKVGGSFVVIDPSGVFIKGPMVQINSGGSADSVADADMTDAAGAATADPGEPINWRDLHKGGGGGKRGHHTAGASHGFDVSRNADGSFQVTPGLRVAGSPDYVSRVTEDLSTINGTKDGHDRIARLDASGRQTTIQDFPPGGRPASANAFTSATNDADASAAGKPSGATDASGASIPGTGRGSDSQIQYDPNDWPSPTQTKPTPGDAILNHELGHADNNAHGQRDMTPRADNYGNQEEFNNLPNDNAYRGERGYPRRSDYADF